MAILRIDDKTGQNTVDLLDLAGLHLAERGWRPATATTDPSGNYLPVVEKITLNWAGVDDDARDAGAQLLGKHGAWSRERVRRRLLSDPVWLEARSYGETFSRFAEIRDIRLPELAAEHWGAAQPVTITLEIEREGLWRKISPASAAHDTLATGTNLAVWTDNTDNNYVDINASALDGDGPMLNLIEIEPLIKADNRFIVAARSAPLATLNQYDPFFNALDELDQVAARTANTAAPDDTDIEFVYGGGGGGHTLRWSISAANVAAYNATFGIYAVVRNTAAGVVTIRLRHGPVTTDYLAVPADIDEYPLVYFGRHAIPSGASLIPGQSYIDSYDLRLDVSASGAATFKFLTLFLVPLDEIIIRAHGPPATIDTLAIDGRYQRAYMMDSGQLKPGEGAVPTFGEYPQLAPFLTRSATPATPTYYRIWLYNSYMNGTIEMYRTGAQNNDLAIYGVGRYLSIRGDDA